MMKKKVRGSNAKKHHIFHSNNLLITVIIVFVVVVSFFLIRQPSDDLNQSDLVGEAFKHKIQDRGNGPQGLCSCSFAAQHTRFFSSNLQANNQPLELTNNDAHSRKFNQLKSQVIKQTESFSLNLPQTLHGVFTIGAETGSSTQIFKGVCSQKGNFVPLPEVGACRSDGYCQQLCPQVEGVGDLLLQLEMDCAEFISRSFNGIIENKLSQRGISLFVQQDIDDLTIKGECQGKR